MLERADIEILINIDFWNLHLWTFFGREDRGLRETSMGRFWLQNRFVSLLLYFKLIALDSYPYPRGVLPYQEVGGRGGLGPGIEFRGKIWGNVQSSSPNKRKNLGSSVTTTPKNWEKITIWEAFGVIFEIQRAKFGVSVTYIFGGKIWGSNMNFRGKLWGQAPPDLLIWKYPIWVLIQQQITLSSRKKMFKASFPSCTERKCPQQTMDFTILLLVTRLRSPTILFSAILSRFWKQLGALFDSGRTKVAKEEQRIWLFSQSNRSIDLNQLIIAKRGNSSSSFCDERNIYSTFVRAGRQWSKQPNSPLNETQEK